MRAGPYETMRLGWMETCGHCRTNKALSATLLRSEPSIHERSLMLNSGIARLASSGLAASE